MKILFVCKHNRFRSRISETIFLRLDKGKNEVKSAGFVMNGLRPWVARNVMEAMKKRGYGMDDGESKPLTEESIDWADKIIVAADDADVEKILPKKKTIYWDVGDCSEEDKECIEKTIDRLEKEVKSLHKKISS